jgi:hypothetical protein
LVFLGGTITVKKQSDGQTQVHIRLPYWLMEHIIKHSETVGQPPSAEIRRALVKEFGEKEKGRSS